MRPAPAVQVVIVRFGAWRIGVALLALLSAAGSVAWLVMWSGPTSPEVIAAGCGAALLSLVLGASLARVRPTSLRWDGQLWHLGPAASAGEEPQHGALTVAIDLGAWMLLRFAPDTAADATASAGVEALWRRRVVTWLPVQRRGLEGRWHALRCAVYSPRSLSGHGPPADV